MTPLPAKKAAVIGSGIAGLATSVRLALQGYRVKVFEANDYPGGKLTEIRQDGYRFDAGPSLFTMPHFVTELFELAGKSAEEYFSYQSLDVMTHYFWEDGTRLVAWADQERFVGELADKLGEKHTDIIRFLNKSKEIYDITEHVFLKKSLHKLDTYFQKDTMRSMLQLHKLNITRSMNAANERFFTNPKTVQFFNRYATYNGSNPYQAPATLNIIPHLENGIGAFFPKGGMHAITMSIYRLAKDLGVEFYFQEPVRAIKHQAGKVTGILTEAREYEADLVVTNMDMVNTYRKLLRNIPAPERLLRQPKSSSALIFYWGVKRTFPELNLHNILFSDDYKKEFQHIFEKKNVGDDPTVYINITSKLAPQDAPTGFENWFTMINVPNNGGQDWDALINRAREAIINKISRMLDEDIDSLIETEAILDPRLIEQKTSSWQGALYGNSSNNPFAAFLRHPNFSKRLSGLYFCGGSVHPGGGIPLCLLSAKIVGDLVPQPVSASQ